MHTAATVLVVLVALEHVWFGIFEAFLWDTPLGRKAFQLTEEQAKLSAPLAKNQGLYNVFLAAGLLWSLVPGAPDPLALQTFFLACVIVAGIVGALTAKWSIFVLQAVPAIAALAVVRGAA
jgi:putative membrane protein